MELALVATVLFVVLMFTRRRLDEVEKRSRLLSDRLDELQSRQERGRAEVERLKERLAALQRRAGLESERLALASTLPPKAADVARDSHPERFPPRSDAGVTPQPSAASPGAAGEPARENSGLGTANLGGRDQAVPLGAGGAAVRDRAVGDDVSALEDGGAAGAAGSGALGAGPGDASALEAAGAAGAGGGGAGPGDASALDAQGAAGAAARAGEASAVDAGGAPGAAESGSFGAGPGDASAHEAGAAGSGALGAGPGDASAHEAGAAGSGALEAGPGDASAHGVGGAAGAAGSGALGAGPGDASALDAGGAAGAARSGAFGAQSPDPLGAGLAALRELLFGGNTVVRVGVLILLIGVVMLLRWAAEHAYFPIELRLIGAALLAIGLIVVGFRQRSARAGFSRALQGGGVAGLYLVIFFAFRTYGLLPAPLAFALLVSIAVASGALSVLQNSRSLIMIAQVFGFAAPLLASTGKGSHVALFSYYLVLNLAIAGIAWFKAWRALNVLGFVFTFGVATAWGVLSYEPRHFASTEPFLIAFFLLYVAIPLLYALRHPGTPSGWVDGSLVFGTPLAALGLQWSLVHERPFAMAFSALGMATIYLGLAYIMKRRVPDRLAMLGEAFLPIGVGFATLAIPYGLGSHNLTGAAWALEGAGLYWVGVRQRRALSRAAGVILQLLAFVALALDPKPPEAGLAILNSLFLAGLLLALSSLFIAYYAYANRSQLVRDFKIEIPLLAYGLWILFATGEGEIDSWVPQAFEPGAHIAWLGLLGLGLELIAGKLAWHTARYPGFLLWLAMFGLLVYQHFDLGIQPLARGGDIGWPIFALAMGLTLRRFAPRVPFLERTAHPLALWLWTGWCLSLAEHAIRAAELDSSYVAALRLTVCVLVLLAVLALSRGASWPIGAHGRLYATVGGAGLALALMLGVFVANVKEPGSSAPIPYLPVLNALDLAILLAFASLLAWLRRVPALRRGLFVRAFALLAFISWNGLLARSVHHYDGVAFTSHALWDSVPLQVAFSLSWTLIALCVMLAAHRRRARQLWWGGAALLTLVVLKLFVLDLAELSTPAKIGTFLGVGLLLLVVGALAPVPPPIDRAPEGPR